VAFTYLKVKSAKCLCLLPVHGLGLGLLLGLKNLVLFTSLVIGQTPCGSGLKEYTRSISWPDVVPVEGK